MLALAGSGPILVPPDEAHRHLDISIDGSRRLPASGIAQQADERPVVTAPIADLIHSLSSSGGIFRGSATPPWRTALMIMKFLSRMTVSPRTGISEVAVINQPSSELRAIPRPLA